MDSIVTLLIVIAVALGHLLKDSFELFWREPVASFVGLALILMRRDLYRGSTSPKDELEAKSIKTESLVFVGKNGQPAFTLSIGGLRPRYFDDSNQCWKERDEIQELQFESDQTRSVIAAVRPDSLVVYDPRSNEHRERIVLYGQGGLEMSEGCIRLRNGCGEVCGKFGVEESDEFPSLMLGRNIETLIQIALDPDTPLFFGSGGDHPEWAGIGVIFREDRGPEVWRYPSNSGGVAERIL